MQIVSTGGRFLCHSSDQLLTDRRSTKTVCHQNISHCRHSPSTANKGPRNVKVVIFAHDLLRTCQMTTGHSIRDAINSVSAL
ncbi:hypothetical protein L596_005887 [Steinernema carpocapsae]|uniref:Uncharacterized protein n=1 Tax=Steinernema carpocapsae TaxID=34508 RepID=A0A4U8V201_STECR|nr:hypothetical protein L596_005887 [Steinernema carpocapsae]